MADRGKKRRGDKIVLFIVVLFALIGSVTYLFFEFFMPSFKRVSFYDFYSDIDKNKINLILEDERLSLKNNPVLKENEIYIPVDFIKDRIDKYIFWEPKSNKLTITTENKVIRMGTEELNYYVNDKVMDLNLPVYNIDNVAFIPSSLLEDLYNLKITYHEEYKNVIIDMKNLEHNMASTLGKKIPLRYSPNKKSEIEDKLTNEEIYVYESEDVFTKIRTKKGLLGYIETEKIGEIKSIPPEEVSDIKTSESKNKIEGKINLVWDQILKVEGNTDAKKFVPIDGINVLSPTWFKFDPNKTNGDLLNIADKSYVDFAHKNGYQVWALFDDFATENINFTSSILTNPEAREHIVKQLLAFTSIYNIDGINIDFEHVNKGDEIYFIQFLRELNPFLEEQGIILSVDMYVPLYTKHYNRTEIAKVVDYICVMTYDESTGKNKGPGASYNFVEKGILDTLSEVPAEKVIMGIPNYSRVWKNGVRFAEYGKDYTYKFFEENNAKFEWQEDKKLNYAIFEKEEGGKKVTYEVWIEDERALEEKMRIYNSYNLAGVATWVRGLGYKEYFEIVKNNL